MYDINQIADFFIEKVDENKGDAITNLKIQKLLYFSWGWYLTLYSKSLFEDKPEAWRYGPVFNNMYQRFKAKGNQPITSADIIVGDSGISSKDEEFLDDIWCEYGQYSAEKLADMSHDDAWNKAKESGKKFIDPQDVVDYFGLVRDQEQKRQDLMDLVEIKCDNNGLSVSDSLEFLKGI